MKIIRYNDCAFFIDKVLGIKVNNSISRIHDSEDSYKEIGFYFYCEVIITTSNNEPMVIQFAEKEDARAHLQEIVDFLLNDEECLKCNFNIDGGEVLNQKRHRETEKAKQKTIQNINNNQENVNIIDKVKILSILGSIIFTVFTILTAIIKIW